jgi:hypothetical protein
MSLEEVAAECQRTPDTMRKIWRRLRREQGFPRPIAGLGLVWSKPLVVAWLKGMAAWQPPANDDRPADIETIVAAQRAMLREEMARR